MMDYKRLVEGLECCIAADVDGYCPPECPYHFAEDGGLLKKPECRHALQREALRAAWKMEKLQGYLEASADALPEAAK